MSKNIKEQPAISIVMPVYNQEEYIEECLHSVIDQTLKNIEIIVVNDGSKDKSLELINKLAKEDERIIVIDKSNSGYGNSVNIGMSKASGEYIGIVETDDFVAKNMFETLYNLTFGGSVDIVKGSFYDFYENDNDTTEAVENRERAAMPEVDKTFTVREFPQLMWGHPSVWSGIYRREFLESNQIKFLEVKGGGWVDNPFMFETFCKAKSIMWTREPLYYYRKGNINSSSNNITNPSLPFERMHDNLDVIERNHFTDDETLRLAYSRALMYTSGALNECDYENNFDVININAKKLLQRCDYEIFTKYFNLHDQYKYLTFSSPLKSISAKFPKILIYNWLPYDNPWNWGGGVTLYCKNLIETIIKERPDVQIYFLSSGFAYSADTTEIFVRKIGSFFGDKCHQFEVVNSPVPADQSNMFVNPLVALENADLKIVIKKFLDKFGTFSAIHFNNIEGLSFDVLDLKQDYPNTNFVFSLHNYIPMCLTGFYYQRHNHCNCNPFHTGADCIKCSRKAIKKDIAKDTYARGKFGKEPIKCMSENRWIKELGFDRLDEDVTDEDVLEFGKTATAKINKNCDQILAVSKRVYDIAIENGFDKNKTVVSYIGTKIARRQIKRSLYYPTDGLKIAFLGSDINYEEKGYPFLLDTLEKLDVNYASKIDLVLTVKQAEHAEIYQMLKNFRSIKVIQGYKHDDLKDIFYGCHLSIVPVLWEDNLPQISIESVAHGVPVLSSSFGGASELTESELFKFEGGNAEDMLQKIKHFVDNPNDLNEYWKHHKGLVTMSMHCEEIMNYYGLSNNTQNIELSLKDFAHLLMEHKFLSSNMYLDKDNTPSNAYLESLQQTIREYEVKLGVYKDNFDTLDTLLKEEIYIDGVYVKLIKKLNKWFPKGTRRRAFLKWLGGGNKQK